MKYFTPAWHRGDLTDEASGRAFGDYQRHLAGLLPNLPPEVRMLAARVNIHDGLLWEVAVNLELGTLRLTLRCGDLQVGYFDLELEYEQVDLIPELTEALRKLAVARLNLPKSRSSNSALYDEVDRNYAFVVHRILFWHEDWRHRQAGRRLRRQRRDGRWQKRHYLRLRGNFYEELTIRFKRLRITTTPRESRHDITETLV